MKGKAPSKDIKSIVSKIVLNDKESWDSFVERFSGTIYAAVYRTFSAYTHNRNDEDILDAVQETFLRLIKDDYKLLRTYDPSRASLSTWLTVIARSTSLDALRRNRIESVPLEEEMSQIPQPVDHPEPLLEIPEDLLSPRQKLVLHLLFDQGMEVREVAMILHIDEQTVRSTKHKALNQLRRFFADKDDS